MAAQRGTGRSLAMSAVTAALRARTELDARVDAGTLSIFDPPGPGSLEGLVGDEGTVTDALWCQDAERRSELEVRVFTGADPVNYDELLRIAVVIQCMRTGESATLAATDQAAEEIFGEVVGALASAPQIVDGGPSDPTEDGIEAVISGVDWSGAWLPDRSGFLTRAVVEVECSARFALS